MTDVLKDFVVIVESRDGTLRTHSPETFRLGARSPSTHSNAEEREFSDEIVSAP